MAAVYMKQTQYRLTCICTVYGMQQVCRCRLWPLPVLVVDQCHDSQAAAAGGGAAVAAANHYADQDTVKQIAVLDKCCW